MKIVLASVYSCLALVLRGCTTVASVRPLYTQAEIEKPYVDRRMEGEWNIANPDDSSDAAAASKPPCRVRISEPTAGELPYAVEFHCPGSTGESYAKYYVQLVSLDSNTFFDARFDEYEDAGKHLSLGDPRKNIYFC
jgi:hypothetical protein